MQLKIARTFAFEAVVSRVRALGNVLDLKIAMCLKIEMQQRVAREVIEEIWYT
jgi:hypothetical protein